MAFSADTMAVTLALAKKFTSNSITEALTGVKSIDTDPTKTKLIVTTMDDQVFEIDIQQVFTEDQVELINRMSIVDDELAFDGNVIEGMTPEQSALLVAFNSHIQNMSNPHQTSMGNLTDVEIESPMDGQVIMLEGGVYKNKTIEDLDGKVRLQAGGTPKYLLYQFDGETIAKNDENTLSAIGLEGMNTSISELNYISGLDEPIMTKFAKFGNGNIEVYKTVFPTYANLIQFDFSTLAQGSTFLMYVSADETHQNLGTIYLCDNTTNNTDNLPSYAGLSSAPQRDFTVDKINLETEVEGVLPKANMDLSGVVKSSDLNEYMSKDVYDPNNDGIVTMAETLNGLTKTAQELNKDINVDSIIAGKNITIEKDTTNNTVTITSTGGGGGGSSVEKSDINGNIINNGAQMVVYDDGEIKKEINDLIPIPIMSSKDLQDVPVGSIVEYLGENIPYYFLPCDGATYNVNDYLKLFEEIGNRYGGDGITTFAVPNYREETSLTPKMTSDVLPTPYVTSASSIYGNLNTYYPFKAFDGNNATYWMTNDQTTGFLTLDFGFTTKVNKVSLLGITAIINAMPRDFSIEGSNDGTLFIKIKDFSESNWVGNEKKTFEFPTSNYRYYRINIATTNGHPSRIAISEVGFYYTRTNSYIKSDNTHYAVNQYGGFMMDTLWEGSVNANNSTVNLVNSYENYDYLYLLTSYDSVYVNIPVFVKQIVNNATYFGAQVLSIGSVDTTCRFLFTSNTELRLTNSVGNVSINKVIGVRGSVPTIIEGGAL